MNVKIFFMLLFVLTSGCTTVEFVRKDVVPTKQAILRHAPPSNHQRDL
jgi:hypothetical protein